jgi:hypothetical protein
MCKKNIVVTISETEIKENPNYNDLADLVMVKYWQLKNDTELSDNNTCTCGGSCGKNKVTNNIEKQTN